MEFTSALNFTQAQSAGDTVAWCDGTNTYVGVFQSTTRGDVHFVELIGVRATHGVSAADGGGVHIT